MNGPWKSIPKWLLADATITSEPTETRIYYRRAPQNKAKPYIIVSLPYGYDNNNFALGVGGLKIAKFRVMVCSLNSSEEIDNVTEKIKRKMEVLINTTLTGGKRLWRIASMRLQPETASYDSDPVEPTEQGLVIHDLTWRVAFYDPPTVVS